MNYLKQLTTVALWEYRRFYKPKSEAWGLVVMLLISTLFYFGSRLALADDDEKTKLSVTQNTDTLLVNLLSDRFYLNIIPIDEQDELKTEISHSQEGMLLVQHENSFTLHAYKKPRELKKLKPILDEYNKTTELQARGINRQDFDTILLPAVVNESYQITRRTPGRVVMAFVFAGLMIFSVFISFAYQFTAITGEKQLRITEQIVSAIKPQVWMDGKIIGITLTALSSMVAYSLLSIFGGTLFFQFTNVPIATILQYIHAPSILLFFFFSLIGVLMWNSLLAAIASIITDPNNSGKSSLMMVPLLFVLVSFLVIRDPDAPFSVFLSWFPLTSATAMPVRWAVTEVHWLELISSFILLVATFYLFRKLAAKVFRISILITGQELTWGEVVRNIRNT
ncbi:MAG TPA: ABC transporter permease [Bacteroidales bacterium]|nr:ABC transporter permease [Bacteroidales bacterium]